ncbi:MAG: glycerophosphodiester phosphodiesterase, partial [Chloroflexi bacterium]|nr:glycerophosphodiester phosphodiesterase [Chloroflexota bacterium]
MYEEWAAREADPEKRSRLLHGGATDRAPGNTLAAVRDAHALGIDGVELDVRLS